MELPRRIANTGTASGLRLLALPAEIRNQIYHYAITDSETEPKPRSLDFPCTPDEQHLLYAGQTTDWRLHQRLWRGLTQTCRQLRSEFLSMQTSYDVHVLIQDLEKYLHFVSLQAKPQHAGKVQGCIVLHVNRGEAVEYDIYDALMLVLRSSPQLKLRWHESWLASSLRTRNICGVEEIISSAKFLEYIAISATEVWIRPLTWEFANRERSHTVTLIYIHGVDVQLHPEIEQGLMRSNHLETWIDSEAILVWLQDLGASKDHSHIFQPRTPPTLTSCGFISDWPQEFSDPDFSNFGSLGF